MSRQNKLVLPMGYKAAGMHAGIKKGEKKDLALLVSETPASIAGVFTTNQVKAASVKLCRERLAGGKATAIVINSGNANACTGEAGIRDARQMGHVTAEALGVDEATVFVCSTGHIGRPLPMDVIEPGIRKVAQSVSQDGGLDAADAIMTTDTHSKHHTAELKVDGKAVRVLGLAKGAGMIEPNMATMLSFIMTDAAVAPDALQACLSAAVNDSFNRITVDGDRSTNDTVLMMANGEAGNEPLKKGHPDWEAFCQAVNEVTLALAMRIVADGEGVTTCVTVRVKGAVSDEDADLAARAVANSLLVKTSWAGKYANWGRVMDCLGYSRAKVQEDLVDIDYDELPAVRGGMSAGTSQEQFREVTGRAQYAIVVDLHLGSGEALVYSCDCTEEYVRLNM
jgi:glutamate N-acetyltransferase/amino-acid N-acetyltransferase